MREDNVIRIIRYDQLLMCWTNKLIIKYKLNHHADMIRARLRLLGRFLKELKKIKPKIENFMDLCDPEYYDSVIKATNLVVGYDAETGTYKSPSNGSKLKSWIKMIGNHLLSLCIRSHDNEKKKTAKDFLKLHKEEFSSSQSKNCSNAN